MCMEDIRIGREAYVRRVSVTLPAGTATLLVNPNADRIGFIIPSRPSGNNLFVDTQAPTSSAGIFAISDFGIRFNVRDDGSIVKGSFYCFNDGLVASTLVVYEVILQKE